MKPLSEEEQDRIGRSVAAESARKELYAIHRSLEFALRDLGRPYEDAEEAVDTLTALASKRFPWFDFIAMYAAGFLGGTASASALIILWRLT